MKIRRRLFAILVAMLILCFLIGPGSIASGAQRSYYWYPRTSIVWPHDGQGNPTSVVQSRAINVSVWPTRQVPCNERDGWERISLQVAKNNEPVQIAAASGQRILRTVNGVMFPSVEYNNVPADMTTDPTTQYRFVYGAVFSNVWVHAADPRTLYPHPVVPTGYSERRPREVDTRIQIVWPHNGRGNFTPVERATFVNIAVDIFAHSTLKSVPPDYLVDSSLIPNPVLLVAEGNGPLRERNEAGASFAIPERITYTVNGRTYPRWVFNNVAVKPGQQYHFMVTASSPEADFERAYSTIWTHAVDARTFLPHPEVPPPCVP
jgi:hypothetical protein